MFGCIFTQADIRPWWCQVCIRYAMGVPEAYLRYAMEVLRRIIGVLGMS